MNIKPFALSSVLWLLQWWVRNHHGKGTQVVPWRSIRCDRVILVVHQRGFFVYRCEGKGWFSQHRGSECDLPHQTARSGWLILSSLLAFFAFPRREKMFWHREYGQKSFVWAQRGYESLYLKLPALVRAYNPRHHELAWILVFVFFVFFCLGTSIHVILFYPKQSFWLSFSIFPGLQQRYLQDLESK